VPKLYKRAAARRDLVEHAVYLAAEDGEELAERFLSQALASCTQPAAVLHYTASAGADPVMGIAAARSHDMGSERGLASLVQHPIIRRDTAPEVTRQRGWPVFRRG
jgi:hypothetical protein